MRAVIINEPFPSAFLGEQGGYLQSPTGNMYFPKQYSEQEKYSCTRQCFNSKRKFSSTKEFNLYYITKNFCMKNSNKYKLKEMTKMQKNCKYMTKN